MSAAVRAMVSHDSEQSFSKKSAKSLRVNRPGDVFEQEADRVADRVSSGGHVSNWSLSSSGADHIQRDPATAAAIPAQKDIRMIGDPLSPPAADNYGDALGKLAAALAQTDAAKLVKNYLNDQPIVRNAKDFVETPAGIAVVGATAASAIAGLAVAHKGLPVQIPEIPLHFLHPGLTAKITLDGPLNHPTQGSVMFSFGAAPPKHKKKDPSADRARYRAETARISADQKHYGAEDTHRQTADAQYQQAEERRAISDAGSRMLGLHSPQVPGTQPFTLHMRDTDRYPTPRGDSAKKEEILIQRKADSIAGNEWESGPDVESVIGASGRPLDRETRRYMESRIGFDFSKVRIHTDERAQASASALRARAYTVGNHVVFGAGRFSPNTTDGRRLLAHELTHVVQQGASPGRIFGRSAPPPAVSTTAPRHIQRDAEEDSPELSILHPGESLRKLARRIPGYKLFTVIIQYDPVAGQSVTRTPMNLVEEFLKLVGAGQTFKDLQQSGKLDEAFAWLSNEIGKLNLSRELLENLVKEAISVGLRNVTSGVKAALLSMYEVFKPTLTAIKNFALGVLRKIGQFAVHGLLKVLDKSGVLQTILGVGDAISGIIKDPRGFAGNLIAALKKGFNQFGDHVETNLKTALLEWLFGALGNLKIPKEITLGTVFNLALQVLGLDYAKNIRPKLEKALGPEVLNGVEKTAGIIQTVFTKGLGAAWAEIKHLADGAVQSFLASAREWAITTVVKSAAAKIIKLVAPGGAIIEALNAIYSTIEVIIAQAKKIQMVIDGIAKSISKIVAGQIDDAANFIEGVMNRAIPIMIDFFATYLGFGNVAEKVRTLLKGVQDKIGAGVDKVIAYLVEKGKALWGKSKAAVGKVLDWWKQRKEVKEGTEEHAIYMEGTEEQTRLMIASFPALTWSKFLADKADAVKKPTPEQKAAIEQIKLKAPRLEDRLPPSKNDTEKAANVEARRALFDEIAALIVVLGLHRDSESPASVITFKQVGEDDRGTGASASPLSSNFKPGTPPSDKPPIWTKLGSLIGTRNYKRGHLLNENLGGPGTRSNLTPITTKANADHLAQIESKVKTAVLTDKKVMTYTVDAVYETRSELQKPKQMLELEKLRSQRELAPGELKDLKEFEAEQKLCTRLDYEAFELENKGAGWVTKNDSPLKFKDHVDNTIEL